MKCPYCNSKNTNVLDSRPNLSATTRYRRWICNDCDERFTTIEIYREEYLRAKMIKRKLERIGEVLIKGD